MNKNSLFEYFIVSKILHLYKTVMRFEIVYKSTMLVQTGNMWYVLHSILGAGHYPKQIWLISYSR